MKRLTLEQRYTISVMLKQEYSIKAIADCIGKDRSTIYREIHRNCDKRNQVYKADLAERKASNRQKNKHCCSGFSDDIKRNVIRYLRFYFSPEQISGRLKLMGFPSVSHETIYQFIYQDQKQGGDLYLYLRRHKKKYKKRSVGTDKRGQIKDRVSIEERPAIVEQKKRLGDLEIDTVMGKNHKGALLTINDRSTGFVWIRLLKSKEAIPLAKATIEALSEVKSHTKTITADNGKEFAAHKLIAEKLNVNVYFAHPYHSWERGANENTNGLIRQYFPKGSSFENITPEMVQNVQNALNKRPRKRLNYKTPQEIMNLKIEENNVALAV